MVYMEPASLGVKHLFSSFVNSWEEKIHQKKPFIPAFYKYLDLYFFPLLLLLREETLYECIPSMDNNIVSSFIKLFICVAFEPEPKTEEEVEKIYRNLEDIVLFC